MCQAGGGGGSRVHTPDVVLVSDKHFEGKTGQEHLLVWSRLHRGSPTDTNACGLTKLPGHGVRVLGTGILGKLKQDFLHPLSFPRSLLNLRGDLRTLGVWDNYFRDW